MRKLLTVCAFAAAMSTLALAESWTGRLVDATCMEQQKTATTACDANSATTMFALFVSGKAYKLDDAGNAKAMEALKSRADRSANPNSTAPQAVQAKVTGTRDADNILKVDKIDVQ
jgi:hypothetical protein